MWAGRAGRPARTSLTPRELSVDFHAVHPAGSLLRLTALLLLGTLAVHELRYRMAFGAHAGEALRSHGHDHLVVAGPVVATLCAIALATVVLRAAAAARTARLVRVTHVWPGASLGLVALYASQELVESVLAPGHAGGLDGVLGHGGWIAVPASLAVGAAIALVVRAGDLAGATAARWLRELRPAAALLHAPAPTRVASAPALLRPAPLARLGAGRAPPRPV